MVDGSQTGLVDVHSHFFPQALVDALARRTELPFIRSGAALPQVHYGEGNIHPLEPPMTDLTLRLSDMDKQGVELAVLTVNVPGLDWFPVSEGPAIAREVNDELAATVAAHPDRLAWLAALPLPAPEAAAAELERAVANGARGAMIYSNAAGRPLDDPAFEVVWEAAARVELPIMIHPTYPLTARTLDAYALIPTLGFLVDTTSAALRLVFGGLYERHPGFKLVLAHSGSLLPQLIGRIDYEAQRAAARGGLGRLSVDPSEALHNLYTDTVCVWPPALMSALAFFGPEHVMFGTDYPFWEPERSIATLEEVLPDPAARAPIATANARRLFRLDEAPGRSGDVDGARGAEGKPAGQAGGPR
ncbi:MAG TPA: amidohydrolase family protein [Conexibacter sp.]|jgi:aminocarboxymuconate-semialdehyde decarboxylase